MFISCRHTQQSQSITQFINQFIGGEDTGVLLNGEPTLSPLLFSQFTKQLDKTNAISSV